MMDKNWPRWVVASVSSFFDARKDTLNLYFEGSDKAGRREQKDYCEFRMNGPFFREVSRDYWQCFFDINILVCSVKDQKDAHRIYRDIGQVTQMFEQSIPIMKFGDGVDDAPQNQLGCAILENDGRNGGVSIQHFGQFDIALSVLQATVEASYLLTLDT